jgi:hypothetical protein
MIIRLYDDQTFDLKLVPLRRSYALAMIALSMDSIACRRVTALTTLFSEQPFRRLDGHVLVAFVVCGSG